MFKPAFGQTAANTSFGRTVSATNVANIEITSPGPSSAKSNTNLLLETDEHTTDTTSDSSPERIIIIPKTPTPSFLCPGNVSDNITNSDDTKSTDLSRRCSPPPEASLFENPPTSFLTACNSLTAFKHSSTPLPSSELPDYDDLYNSIDLYTPPLPPPSSPPLIDSPLVDEPIESPLQFLDLGASLFPEEMPMSDQDQEMEPVSTISLSEVSTADLPQWQIVQSFPVTAPSSGLSHQQSPPAPVLACPINLSKTECAPPQTSTHYSLPEEPSPILPEMLVPMYQVACMDYQYSYPETSQNIPGISATFTNQFYHPRLAPVMLPSLAEFPCEESPTNFHYPIYSLMTPPIPMSICSSNPRITDLAMEIEDWEDFDNVNYVTGGFGATSSTTPFGQTGFGKMPSTSGFGTPAFGGNTAPMFGGQNQQTSGGLFSTTATAPAFGQSAAPQGGFEHVNFPNCFRNAEWMNSMLKVKYHDAFTISNIACDSTIIDSMYEDEDMDFSSCDSSRMSISRESLPTAMSTTDMFCGTFASSGASNTLFGQQQAAGGNLFGTNTATAFGQTKPATFSSFGTTTSNNLFGGGQTQTGQPTSAPLFGQTAPNNPGLFGNSPAFGNPQAQSGTVVKFNPVSGTDTMVKNRTTHTISTRHHCITCMKEYETKSLEELRFEDYMANRKGPQQGAQASNNLFGSISNPNVASGGLFGNPSNATTGFGQTASVFGTTSQTSSNLFCQKPTGFGATTTSTGSPFSFNPTPSATPFGATAAKPFGNQAPTTGLFSTPSTAPTNTFGQTSSGFGFGAPTSSTNSSFFNQHKPATSTFTMPAANTTGFGFGQPQNNLFGANKTAAPVFGAQTNTFGQPNTAQQSFGANFGQPAQSSNLLFNVPTFNKPATGTFGLPQSNNMGTLSGFGNQQQQTMNNLFGSKSTTSLFGSTQPTQNSMFGNFATPNLNNQYGQVAQPYLASAFNASATNIHEVLIAISSPYPEQPILKNLTPLPESKALSTNPVAVQVLLDEQLRVSTKPPINIHRVRSLSSPEPVKTLFDGLEANDPSIEENIFASKPRNPRRLVLRKFNEQENDFEKKSPSGIIDSCDPASSTRVLSLQMSIEGQKSRTNGDTTFLNTSGSLNETGNSWLATAMERDRCRENTNGSYTYSAKGSISSPNTDHRSVSPSSTSAPAYSSRPSSAQGLVTLKSPSNITPPKIIEMIDNDNAEADATLESGVCLHFPSTLGANARPIGPKTGYLDISQSPDVEEVEPHPTGIICTRPGYYTLPSLDELIPLIQPDGSVIVKSFTIGRKGYGNVYFPASFDVANINIDEHVHFRSKELTVYVDDTNKPSVGHELNRPAQVTLDRVYPRDRQTGEPIKNVARLFEMDYEGILRSTCIRHGTKFNEYRPETGSWVFQVEHFTRYGITEMEEVKVANISRLLNLIPEQDDELSENADEDGDVYMGVNRHRDEEASNDSFLSVNATEGFPAEVQEEDFRDMSFKLNTFFRDDADDEGESMACSQSGALLTISKYVDMLNDTPHAKMTPEEEEEEILCLQNMLRATKKRKQSKFMLESNLPNTVSIPEKLMEIEYSEKTPTPDYAPFLPAVFKRFPTYNRQEYIEIFGNERNCTDLGIFKGAGFRARFGKSGHLVCLNEWPQVQIYAYQTADLIGCTSFKAYIEPHLQIQLAHCDVEDEENPFPYAYALAGPKALHEHFELARYQQKHVMYSSKTVNYMVHVWKLFVALWGENLDLEGEVDESHLIMVTRRECFGQWMEEFLAELINLKKSCNEEVTILDHLIAHQLYEASKLARRKRHLNLGAIITQLSSGPETKEIVKLQLENWKYYQLNTHLNAEIVQIYLLFAGVQLIQFAEHRIVNVCETLNWMQALAVHLWYLCPNEQSIRDVIESYTNAFMADSKSCPPPEPFFTLDLDVSYGDAKIYDLLYHLICIYCNNTHSLDKTLNPANYTNDCLDYRLSWLVMENLKALGYENILEKSATLIHVSFAEQLEREGLWHWAIFVLLHLKEEKMRKRYVLDLISKNVSLNLDNHEYKQKEMFVITELKIPGRYFAAAKAIRSMQKGLWRDAMTYYIAAKNPEMTRKLFWQYVGPTEMCNRNFMYVRKVIQHMMVGLYHDDMHILLYYYIQDIDRIMRMIKEGRAMYLKDYLERMKPQLAAICNKIIVTRYKTLEQRVMITDMCKGIVNIIKEVIEHLNHSDVISLTVIAQLATKLPLPPDYVIQELRDVVSLYVARFVDSTNINEIGLDPFF